LFVARLPPTRCAARRRGSPKPAFAVSPKSSVAGAHLDLTPTDIVQLAQTLRGDPDKREALAFVVAVNRGAFARQFAPATAHEWPVDVFHSLHEARAWIARIQQAGSQAAISRPTTQAVKNETHLGPIRNAKER
jgi:hypothetical protein